MSTNWTRRQLFLDDLLHDCDWINADAIDHKVVWKSVADLGALAGRPVRIEFSLRNARIFAFQSTRSGTS